MLFTTIAAATSGGSVPPMLIFDESSKGGSLWTFVSQDWACRFLCWRVSGPSSGLAEKWAHGGGTFRNV